MELDLPPGIFSVLMSLFQGFKDTYVAINDLFVATTINLMGEDYNLGGLLFGGGISIYIVYTLIKWVLPN